MICFFVKAVLRAIRPLGGYLSDSWEEHLIPHNILGPRISSVFFHPVALSPLVKVTQAVWMQREWGKKKKKKKGSFISEHQQDFFALGIWYLERVSVLCYEYEFPSDDFFPLLPASIQWSWFEKRSRIERGACYLCSVLFLWSTKRIHEIFLLYVKVHV